MTWLNNNNNNNNNNNKTNDSTKHLLKNHNYMTKTFFKENSSNPDKLQ